MYVPFRRYSEMKEKFFKFIFEFTTELSFVTQKLCRPAVCLPEIVVTRQSESTNSKTFPHVTIEISRPLLENRIEALLRETKEKQQGQDIEECVLEVFRASVRLEFLLQRKGK